MESKSRYLVLLCAIHALLGAEQETPSSEEQQKIAVEMTRKALRFQGQLPDFRCTKVTSRREDPTGSGKRWKQRDTLEERVFFSSGRVAIRLLTVDGKPTDKTHLNVGGAMEDSLIGFAIVPDWIFGEKARPRFEWLRQDVIDGKQVHVFSFHVAPSVFLKPHDKSFIVGFHGSVYADTSDASPLRLEVFVDAPHDYPVRDTRWLFDYGVVEISGKPFLLPVKTVTEGRLGKQLFQNSMDFRNYRKFEADSTIKFEEPVLPKQLQR